MNIRSMKKIEDDIRTYLTERNWDNLRPGDLAKSISIEAGELLEIFQWENPSLEAVKGNAEKLQKLRSELADVLIYSIDLAVLLELDTEALILEKLEYVKKKYPKELFQHRSNDPGTEDTYMTIKKEYRKNHD